MTDLIRAGALIAQATCGLYGSPSSPGGCSLPAPGGGSFVLQDVFGQTWVQETPNPMPNFDDNTNTYPNSTDDQ